MRKLNIQVDNIHCEQCESFLLQILSGYFSWGDSSLDKMILSNGSSLKNPKMKQKISGSSDEESSLPIAATSCHIDRISGTVSIDFPSNSQSHNIDPPSAESPKDELIKKSVLNSLKNDLENVGFKISDMFEDNDREGKDHYSSRYQYQQKPSTFSKVMNFLLKKQEQRQRRHLEHCEMCRKGSTEIKEDDLEVVVSDPIRYRAVFAISGMTCASCGQNIETAILRALKTTVETDVPNIAVDPLTHTAVVVIPNKQIVQKIIDHVNESGYTALLVEILPVSTERRFKVTAAIGGITCAACASTISHAVGDLAFVEDVAVNVVSKTGVFILDSNDASSISLLQETIEDCGYDFTMMGNPEPIHHTSLKKQTRTVNLKIEGMLCNHCPERVNTALSKFGDAELIVEDSITLQRPYIKFTYVPDVAKKVTIRSIIEAIRDELYEGPASDVTISIVEEMSLDDHLKKMAKRETIEISVRLLISTIIAIPTFIFGVVGMSLLPEGNRFRKWLDSPIWRGNASRDTWILFILSTPIYFFIDDLFHRKAFMEVRALWRQKNNWKRRLFRFGSMNLLMSLGTSVAYFASIALLIIAANSERHGDEMGYTTTYFDSVVFLTFFLLIGRLLESFSKSRTAQAINELGSLKKHEATLVDYRSEGVFENDQILDIKYLEIGDYIKISPGESLPVDCIIVKGESEFDESALTGESIPIDHSVGEQIFAGTVNVGNKVVIGKLCSLDGSSLIDQIVKSVREGQLKRAPIERLADILTGYFVPIITLLAVITWVIWIVLGYSGALPNSYLDIDLGGWALWSLEFAISVFVVACPCGIGLAAPTALFVGAGIAARNGILARGGGAAFQEGSKVSVVCFDKTGTLTSGGKPKITNFAIHNHPKLKTIAVQVTRDMELASKHPLSACAKTFVMENFSNLIGNVKIPNVEVVAGKGLKGEIVLDNEQCDSVWSDLKPEAAIIGNEKFTEENDCHLSSTQIQLLTEWKVSGKSIIIVALKCERFFGNSKYFPVLLMAARDELRPEAKGVIKQLQNEGIECWMISGDNAITAKAIAKELNIDNIVAEVLPDEKADKVKWIQNTRIIDGKPAVVAMVGDGINDGPALASADVGIALASGSDLAMTSCDFVLLNSTNTLSSLLTLLQLSRKVFARVRFNFGWALIYNMIGVPIAAGVIYPYNNSRLSPVWASAAMAASSVSVVLSSLALKFFRPSKIINDPSYKLGLENTEVVEEKFA